MYATTGLVAGRTRTSHFDRSWQPRCSRGRQQVYSLVTPAVECTMQRGMHGRSGYPRRRRRQVDRSARIAAAAHETSRQKQKHKIKETQPADCCFVCLCYSLANLGVLALQGSQGGAAHNGDLVAGEPVEAGAERARWVARDSRACRQQSMSTAEHVDSTACSSCAGSTAPSHTRPALLAGI